MNRTTERDAVRARRRVCSSLIEKKRNFLDTAGVVRDTALIRTYCLVAGARVATLQVRRTP